MIPFPYQSAGAGIAQMPETGGGGAGLPPNGIGAGANLTFWYNGDASLHYTLPESTSPQATTNGSEVQRFDSDAAISRICSEGIIAPDRLVPAVGSSNGVRFYGNSNGQIKGYVKPSAGATPTTALAMSQIFTTSNAIYIGLLKVDNTNANSGTTYSNEYILGDNNGYIGLYAYKNGTDVIFQAYNYNNTTGENPACTTSVPLGTWAVVTFIHRSNLVKIRKNGVEIASVSSGATGNLTSGSLLIGTAFANTDFSIAQFCTYNSAITDANILQVERWFGAKAGLSF